MINPRTLLITVIIISASMWRLISLSGHTPLHDFTPIGAMALFGGCYFSDKWKAYLVPLCTLWLTDLVLSYFVYHHFTLFYQGFAWTYGAFAIMVMVGTFIKKVSIRNVIMASVITALLHYIITDFGTWIGDQIYPLTWQGFIACYVAAIPYFLRMLEANLLFGGLMFGAFELAKKKFPVLATR